MDTNTEGASQDTPISVAALGTLVAFLETSGLDRRRYRIVNRLRALSNSDEFASLPDDLRDRVREIVRDADRQSLRVAVSNHELLHRVRAEDRERILDCLNSRATAGIERDIALRRAEPCNFRTCPTAEPLEPTLKG